MTDKNYEHEIDNKLIDNKYMQENFKLNNKYIIEKVISNDDEATVYLGKDVKCKNKFFIKEFYPQSICKRNHQNGMISPIENKEVQFKTLYADYEYMCETIITLSDDEILPNLLEMLHLNGTIYAIYAYSEAIKLTDYFNNAENSIFQWIDIKQKFLKFCQAVGKVHSKGMIHRGISLETVYIDNNNNLLLKDFSTAANRTASSEINATLFDGYSAPEQYSPKMWQGYWTDIYSLGALLYRLLTGIVPTKNESGIIQTADSLNTNIPGYVSDSISSAMMPNFEFRLQSVDEFTAMLLEDISSNTVVFGAALNDNEFKLPRYPDENTEATILQTIDEIEKKPKKKVWAITLYILTICILSIIVYKIGLNNVPQEVVEPPKEEYIEVPFTTYAISNFVGRQKKEILDEYNSSEQYNFIIKEEFSDTIKFGDVIKQAPKAGTKAVNKANIVLTVSKGRRTAFMPNIVGKDVETAIKMVKNLGLKYEVFEIVDENLQAGIVSKTNFEAGIPVDIYKDTVYIFTKRVLNE